MKLLIAISIAVLLSLQVKLWLGKGGIGEVARLDRAIAAQQRENDRLLERNQALAAEVSDLRQGREAIEERARSELGMIGHGETFYRIVDSGE